MSSSTRRVKGWKPLCNPQQLLHNFDFVLQNCYAKEKKVNYSLQQQKDTSKKYKNNGNVWGYSNCTGTEWTFKRLHPGLLVTFLVDTPTQKQERSFNSIFRWCGECHAWRLCLDIMATETPCVRVGVMVTTAGEVVSRLHLFLPWVNIFHAALDCHSLQSD